jgi:hypothetical protein
MPLKLSEGFLKDADFWNFFYKSYIFFANRELTIADPLTRPVAAQVNTLLKKVCREITFVFTIFKVYAVLTVLA